VQGSVGKLDEQAFPERGRGAPGKNAQEKEADAEGPNVLDRSENPQTD
jgi:hypothetical protein